MSREAGFDVADIATGLFEDPKVKALWRALGDQARMSQALTLYTATLLASWQHGLRVTVTEAVPIWLTPDPELVEALRHAKLLDRTAKLPVHSWRSWFDPAFERREARRESGRLGGLRARGKRSHSDAVSIATASPHLTGRQAGPSVLPTGRPTPRAPARGDAPKNGADDERGFDVVRLADEAIKRP